jgi:AcrR family transcriptional regulator
MDSTKGKSSINVDGRPVVYATKAHALLPIDRRKTRTLHALFTAFERLAGSIPLDGLSVGALAEAADINRVTFYSHFKSLDEIVERTVKAALTDSAAAMNDPIKDPSAKNEVAANIHAYVEALLRHKALFAWVAESSYRYRMNDLFFEGILEIVAARSALVSGLGLRAGEGEKSSQARKTELFMIYSAAGISRMVLGLMLGEHGAEDIALAEELLPSLWLPSAYEALGILGGSDSIIT